MNNAAPVIDHKDLLSSAEAIDALPITVSKLASIISDGDHDIREIVDVVSLDQALTATLLRRANSAALGGAMQIKTVRDAAVRMGTGSLLSMALAASVSGRMNHALPAYGLAEGELWKQSVAASVAADLVRVRARIDVPTEASTAALLHDFGKIVLSNHFGPQVLDLLRAAAQSEGISILEAEQTIFGVTHADIGGVVAQQWKLPYTIVDAIIHHHVTGPDHTPISATVSLAHGMVHDILHFGETDEVQEVQETTAPSVHEPVVESHAAVLAVLGIPAESYDDLLGTAHTKYLELADRYAVD